MFLLTVVQIYTDHVISNHLAVLILQIL